MLVKSETHGSYIVTALIEVGDIILTCMADRYVWPHMNIDVVQGVAGPIASEHSSACSATVVEQPTKACDLCPWTGDGNIPCVRHDRVPIEAWSR